MTTAILEPDKSPESNDWQDSELGILTLAQATGNLAAPPLPQFPSDLNADDAAAIMRAGGWKSLNVLSRYLEMAEHNVWA